MFTTVFTSPYVKRMQKAEALREFDIKYPLPDTVKLKQLRQAFKHKEDEELIAILKPFADPHEIHKGMVTTIGFVADNSLTGKDCQSEIEYKLASKEFLKRGLSADCLTGQACTVM